MRKLWYVQSSGEENVSLQFSNVIENGKAVGRAICIMIEQPDGTCATAFFDKSEVTRLIRQLSTMKAVLGGNA